jgi:hypothetical protein
MEDPSYPDTKSAHVQNGILGDYVPVWGMRAAHFLYQGKASLFGE